MVISLIHMTIAFSVFYHIYESETLEKGGEIAHFLKKRVLKQMDTDSDTALCDKGATAIVQGKIIQ